MFQNEQEEFFHMHKNNFPEDLQADLFKYFELRGLFFETIPQFEKTVEKPLMELMVQQYVGFSINDPAQKPYLQEISKFFYTLIWGIYFLLEDQKNGIDLHEKYPQLERWRSFYLVASVPEVLTDKDRNYLMFENDQEWEEYKEKDNKRSMIYHQWQEDRQKAFYDVIQPILFKLFPELMNIEGDSWVILAMLVRDSYEQWKSFCERLESIIEYELPLESFYWENEAYYKAKQEKGPAFLNMCIENWEKRIYGDLA